MLTNIHSAAAEGNFCNEGGKGIKPHIVTDYNHHMGYVGKGDRMASSYSISCRTFKWTKNLFFRLLDLAILNSYILHSLCGGKKLSHRYFRYTIVRNVLGHAEPEQRVPMPLGRYLTLNCTSLGLKSAAANIGLSHLRCCVCKARGVTQKVFMKCHKCKVGLCVKNTCFEDYHTKAQF